MTSLDTALVFGARGFLGGAIAATLEARAVRVIRASTAEVGQDGWLSTSKDDFTAGLSGRGLNRVIWAQGRNSSGSISGDGPSQMVDLFEANVNYIVRTLRQLLDANALASGARLVVVSSIWQGVSRQEKLAYATTKAAVAGLVRSLAADLGPLGISINAVLPGPVDGPMTRSFLDSNSLANLEAATPLGRLVTANEVAEACMWLSGSASSGVNAQFLAVDGGWSEVRYV